MAGKGPDGWIPTAVIAAFNKMADLRATWRALAEALWVAVPETMELRGDGAAVRRAVDRVAPQPKQTWRRCVVVENLPHTMGVDAVRSMFGAAGEVEIVWLSTPQKLWPEAKLYLRAVTKHQNGAVRSGSRCSPRPRPAVAGGSPRGQVLGGPVLGRGWSGRGGGDAGHE